MQTEARKPSMLQMLVCGAASVTLSMGIRPGFGLWLRSVTQGMCRIRQSFARALAVQRLLWDAIGILPACWPTARGPWAGWLSTVPPTNANVAQIFGVRHLSVLEELVFFSHQLGSFMGRLAGRPQVLAQRQLRYSLCAGHGDGCRGRAFEPAGQRAPDPHACHHHSPSHGS